MEGETEMRARTYGLTVHDGEASGGFYVGK